MKYKKKKVAFCFSGQARTFNLCYPYVKKNLLDPVGKRGKDYDIFCCVEDDGDAHKVNLLKPTRIVKVKSRNFREEYKDLFDANYKKFFGRRGDMNKHLNQLNKIFLSNDLRKKYQNEKKISYNWVFRIRFDMLPLNEIDYSQLNKKYLYTPKTKPNDIPVCNDMVAIGSDKILDIYSGLIKEFRNTLKTFFSEKFRTSLKISLFLEKKYTSFFEFLSNHTTGILSKFFGKMVISRGLIFLRPANENCYALETALLRYLKDKEIKIKIIDIDYIIVRKEWSHSGVLLSKQTK